MKKEASVRPEVAFREVQRFRQKWLWAVLLVSTLPVLLFVVVDLWRPLVTWTITTSDLIGLVFCVVVVIGALWFMAAVKLVIEVRREVLYVHFWPVRKQIPYTEIIRCEARTYAPIKEYGGWGIRWSLRGRGKAYNVSGKEGVQLEFKNGKRLLLGSQRAGELEAAIRARLPKQESVSP